MNRNSFIPAFLFLSFFSQFIVGHSNFLYSQVFTRITTGSIATDTGNSRAVTWADYNNDGNVDLFVPNTVHEDNFLYLNNGDGTFTKIISSTIVNDSGIGNSEDATWGDYDNDGDLDVFIAYMDPNNQLHSNNGDGTFTK
ncbi:MAG: FG-GAP repeat domain-containing protein, partial [bacterium]